MSWEKENNKLVREFEFSDFKQAFAFMSKVALIAEKADHHPEIINNYSSVILKLSTHDAGDIITDKDRNLAEQIDALL